MTECMKNHTAAVPVCRCLCCVLYYETPVQRLPLGKWSIKQQSTSSHLQVYTHSCTAVPYLKSSGEPTNFTAVVKLLLGGRSAAVPYGCFVLGLDGIGSDGLHCMFLTHDQYERGRQRRKGWFAKHHCKQLTTSAMLARGAATTSISFLCCGILPESSSVFSVLAMPESRTQWNAFRLGVPASAECR